MKKLLIFSFLPFILNAAKAPDFTVTDSKNKVHNLYTDYLNKDKVVVIKFFFVDCPPCNAIASTVQASYIKWGGGSGRVQFFEISTQTWDKNVDVAGYSTRHGITYPGVGTDGGSVNAVAPYKAGTFGTFIGTPSFAVISPDGEVKYNVLYTMTNQVEFDTAIARALRVTSGNSGGGGGGGCSKAFTINTVTTIKPDQVVLRDNTNIDQTLTNSAYNCEFTLPQNTSNHFVFLRSSKTFADPYQGITTADILAIQKYLLGLQSLNNMQLAAADVNNSGTVSAADMSEIRKFILGVTTNIGKTTTQVAICHNPRGTDGLIPNKLFIDALLAKTKNNEFGIWKYGDVNGVSFFKNEISDDRNNKVIPLQLKITLSSSHEFIYELINTTSIAAQSIQFDLSTMSHTDIINSLTSDLSSSIFSLSQYSNLNSEKNSLRISYNSNRKEGLTIAANTSILKFKTSTLLDFSLGQYIPSEIITMDDETYTISLQTRAINSNYENCYLEDANNIVIQSTKIYSKIIATDIQGKLLGIGSANKLYLDSNYKGVVLIKAESETGATKLFKLVRN